MAAGKNDVLCSIEIEVLLIILTNKINWIVFILFKMTNKTILLLHVITAIFFIGCSKSENIPDNIASTVSGSPLYTYPVRVRPDQYGKIELHFENFNVLLFGVIDGNELAYTHSYNYFTGTKP